MRRHWLSLASLLLLGPAALAQQGNGAALARPTTTVPPAPAAAPAPPNPVLDAHLANWEKRMADVQSLAVQLQRVDVSKGFNSTDVFEGSAQYMRPNLAIMHMARKDKPEMYERYVCTGTYVYAFVPSKKVLRAYEIPKARQEAGAVADDNMLSLLFSTRAAEAKARYDLSLEKEDQYYVYIKILPKRQEDKADFAQARLVLNRETYLPRQLWYVQPSNGDEVKWEIQRIEPNVKLDRKQFEKPALPAGWNLEVEPQPSVVRPKQP